MVDCSFSCHQLSLPWQLFCCFFVRYFVFVLLYCGCHGFLKASFTFRRFLLYTPSWHLPQQEIAPTWFQGFSGSRQFFLEVAGASQLFFENHTRPIGLFASHSAQQKVLLGRLSLRAKALRNNILTYSRFWAHSLISTCFVKCMSFPLGHRSSQKIMVNKCI